MSELTTFKWDEKRIIWFLDFIISILDSAIGWSCKFAEDENICDRLRQLRNEAQDAREQLGYITNNNQTQQ